MSSRPNKKNVSIQQVLTALLDTSTPFPPTYLHQFSDLEGSNLEALRSIWPQINPQRRYNLLEDLEELAEADTLVSFDNVARLGLDDPDPRVRTVAVRLLWEDEDPRLVPVFLRILQQDANIDARAAAATALGLFIYLGELEELDEKILHQVEDRLIEVMRGSDDTLVRRRALESLGFSGRDEVAPLIRQAYDSGDPDWMSSALFAMGRSADQVWVPEIKRTLRHPKANVQLEAVRAAGELAIETARRTLLDMLEEEAQDSEVRPAVIWSLSQIGGEEVRETLEQILEETDDEEEMDLVEKALDNLTFTEDMDMFSMLDFPGLGQVDREINLEDEERELNDDPFNQNEDDEETGGNGSSSTGRDPGRGNPHRRSS